MSAPGRFCITILLACILSGSAWAGDAVINEDGSTTWQAGVDGVVIEWSADGSVKRLYSKYSQPVEFADRRGISTAQVIAEERAKGAIVRFIQQAVASSRLVTEVESDVNKATQERQSATKPQVKKFDQRTLITNLTEITGSFAAGTLRGVIVLEKSYDDKTQEAAVVVGISEKTIRAAHSVQNMITAGGKSAASGESAGADGLGTQPGELRKSRQTDW